MRAIFAYTKSFALVLALLVGGTLPLSANHPFATLEVREVPTHLKAHLWEYFAPTEDPFMKGNLLWIKGQMGEIRVISSDDGRSYEATFLMKCYTMSQPWQNYTEEDVWRNIPGRKPDLEFAAGKIRELAGIMEKHSLENRKTASVLKTDGGEVDAVWNHWKVNLPLEKRDAIFELIAVYLSPFPLDGAVSLYKQ